MVGCAKHSGIAEPNGRKTPEIPSIDGAYGANLVFDGEPVAKSRTFDLKERNDEKEESSTDTRLHSEPEVGAESVQPAAVGDGLLVAYTFRGPLDSEYGT